jgi:Integrase core domain
VRDNDCAYGQVFRSRVRARGIRDRPISPRSPWQNPYVERLIGTARRECLDRVLVFGEAHLRQILSSYAAYYNEVRTHWPSTRMRPWVGLCSALVPSSLSQSCLGCTTTTSGYNFRKGPDIALLLLLHYRDEKQAFQREFAVTRLIAPLSIELIFRPRLGVARQHASQI